MSIIKQPSWRMRSDSAACSKDPPEAKTEDETQKATAHLDVPAGDVTEDDSKTEHVLSKDQRENDAEDKTKTKHVLSDASPGDKPVGEPEDEIKKVHGRKLTACAPLVTDLRCIAGVHGAAE